MQSDKNTSFQTLLRIRVLKHRAKKLLKSHMFSMKAYIPLTFSNFFHVFHVDDVGSTREPRPQGGVAHKNDANFPSIVVIAKCRVRRLLISG